MAKALLLLLIFFPAYAAASGLGELRLSLIEGDVQIKTPDTSEWTPAVINFPLKDGDQLWVPQDGRAEVESRRGTILRLDERSTLDVLTVDDDALQFYLPTGLVYVNNKGARGTTLQLDTPLSSIRVYERAKFSTEVSNKGDTDISVFLGAISAESRKGETMVKPGHMLSLGKNSADLSPLGSIDAWERWNGDQDRIIEQRKQSRRYLPEELAGYSRDLEDNGEWVDMPSYGHVWRPTIQLRSDWSPYRHGRWVWIGGDYVWIAQEPWGWAPYHYGRWSFISRHGWCWVPPARHEAYWGPGYVGWVRTPTTVSWVPLAPREVYYGHGDYGPHSVNILHVDVNKVVVKNVYQNVSVKNSVTTVHHDTFVRGKQVDFTVNENPFLKEKISVGRPQIKPERATMRASNRDIPKANEPPALVKEAMVNDVRERRHLVKGQDRSVFLPEEAPQVMPVAEEKEPRSEGPQDVKYRAEERDPSVPPKVEESQTAPADREKPPEGIRESKQEEPSQTQGTQSSPERDGSQEEKPLSTPPPVPTEDAPSSHAERDLPPEQAAPEKPEREGKQRPPSGPHDTQSNPEAGDSLPYRRSPRHQTTKEEIQPTPAERELPPEQAVPSEIGRGAEPESPPAPRDRQEIPVKEDGQEERRINEPPAPREEAQQNPAHQEARPEQSRPPDRRPKIEQMPPSEPHDTPPLSDEGDSQASRRSNHPKPPEQEAQPTPPSATREGATKDEGASPTPDQKKKTKKEQSAEDEAKGEEEEEVPTEKPAE